MTKDLFSYRYLRHSTGVSITSQAKHDFIKSKVLPPYNEGCRYDNLTRTNYETWHYGECSEPRKH